MTTSDFERIASDMIEAVDPYYPFGPTRRLALTAQIIDQLRQVWNLRGAADIAAIDEVAHTNGTAVEAAIKRLDLAEGN